MSSDMIEHRGIVQRVEGGKVIVAMETGGCESCGHGSSCGLGKIAGARASTLLTLSASGNLKAGDVVTIGLPENRMTVTALIGYLFPAVALLLGAGLGATLAGSDEATALGAIVGFLGALGIARIALWIVPGLHPVPQLIYHPRHPIHSQQEFRHERSYDH
jgi:sigma-E factor negative regulatory protein RseC